VSALLTSACAGDPSPPARGGDAATDSAYAILSRVTPTLSAEAFERLRTVPFTADVRTRGAGDSSVRNVYRNERLSDGSTRLVLASGAGDTPAGVEDPVSGLVPGNPPYLAPRTRHRYRVRLIRAATPGGSPLIGAEAVLAENRDEEAVRRARAWTHASTGRPYALEVTRQASSAIYDEAGRAAVRFTDGPAGVLPAAAAGRSRVDVPFGPPRVVEVDILISETGQ
jgi:hypothetical protein